MESLSLTSLTSCLQFCSGSSNSRNIRVWTSVVPVTVHDSDEHIYGLAEPDYATERLDNSPPSSYCTYGPLLRPVAVGDLLDQYTENSHAPNLRYDLDTEPIGIDLRSLPARHGLVPDLVSNAIAKIELDLMQRSIYIPLDEARGRLPIFDGLYPTRTDILLN